VEGCGVTTHLTVTTERTLSTIYLASVSVWPFASSRGNMPNVVDEEYLAWLRLKPCAARERPMSSRKWRLMLVNPFHQCVGKVQASHEDHGLRHDDDRAFPACAQVHTDYHQLGERLFMETYGFCPHCTSKLYREIYEAERSFV